MRIVHIVASSTLFLAACHGIPTGSEEWGTLRPTSVASYNVAGLPGDEGPAYVATVLRGLAPELIALQECRDCVELADAIGDTYVLGELPRAGAAIAFDSSRFRSLEEGAILLAESDDGWGERYAVWNHLEAIDTGETVVFYSTHFCVPIRTSDDLCTTGRQLGYVDQILAHIATMPERVPVILAGDFNVFGGFEVGRVVTRLQLAGLRDVFREVEPEADGTTFIGNDWAPAGRIDYVFGGPTADVETAAIAREGTVEIPGLDHYPLTATLRF